MSNTHTRDHDSLTTALDATRRYPDAAAIGAATERFRDRLPSATRRTRSSPVLRWGAAALLGVAIIAAGPLLMPTTTGVAFAAVQAWFERFDSVRIETVMTRGNAEINRLDVWATRDGRARIETGPITMIADPDARTLYTLLPGNQVMTVPYAGQEAAGDEAAWAAQADGLGWFEDLRTFRGEALPLRETRTIRGSEARGYHLEIDRMAFTLWADVATDEPRLLEATLPGGMRLESRLWFDEAFAADVFDLPAGATPVTATD